MMYFNDKNNIFILISCNIDYKYKYIFIKKFLEKYLKYTILIKKIKKKKKKKKKEDKK